MEDKFDVESLIGNTITCDFEDLPSKVKIGAIAEDVGWTLVDTEDPTRELACWNGKLSPYAGSSNIALFDRTWPLVVRMLRDGHFDGSALASACGGGSCASGATLRCAFS